VAGVALNEAIPLGRVWSFPSKIVVPPPVTYNSYLLGSDALYNLSVVYYNKAALDRLAAAFKFTDKMVNRNILDSAAGHVVKFNRYSPARIVP
jgi:hypothetical protein